MILDALCKVAAAQQVTADAVSGSSYDAGNVTPKRRLGAGEPMVLLTVITAVGTNSGSSKIQAVMSAAAALTSPVIVGEVDLVAADLIAGKVIITPIGDGPATLRFWGSQHDITGTVDYTVDQYIVPASMASRVAESYAKGYTIS